MKPCSDPMCADRTAVKAEFPQIEEVGRFVSGCAAPRDESAEQAPRGTAIFSPVATKIARASRASGAESLQVGGECDERLGGRQRVAVGVVGPVHGEAEGAGQVGEAHGGAARRAADGEDGGVPGRAPRCRRTDCSARARGGEGGAEEAALDRGNVRDQGAAGERVEQAIEHARRAAARRPGPPREGRGSGSCRRRACGVGRTSS